MRMEKKTIKYEPIEPKSMELRQAYGQAMVKLAQMNDRVVMLDCDVAHPVCADLFARQFPERFFQMGIAEQNLMGVASGLATCGFIPFTNCFACFASKRAHDQVSISVAYAHTNVKIVGSYSGISTPNTGATHQSIDDIATMRSIPNMMVVVPADAVETEQAVFALADYPGPAYLRIARSPAIPPVFDRQYDFQLGKAVLLKQGSDLTLVGTGIMTSVCLRAAEALKKEHVEAAVLHVPTIKPLDVNKIVEMAKTTGAIVSAENHSIIGGLGSAISEVLVEKHPCPMERVGIPDTFCESAAEVEDLLDKYGLTCQNMVEVAKSILVRKR